MLHINYSIPLKQEIIGNEKTLISELQILDYWDWKGRKLHTSG